MRLRIKIFSLHLVVFAFAFCLQLAHAGTAESFPFRNLGIGAILPPLHLEEYRRHEPLKSADLAGREFILFFWGADTVVKKKRAIKSLSQARELVERLNEKKIPFIVINIMHDSPDLIEEVLRHAKLTVPVYYDAGRNLYGDLGIFIMPCVLLAGKDGKLAAGIPYSHDFADQVLGEVAVLRGEKSREQLNSELKPVMPEIDEGERDARRHFNMGKAMIRRGQSESAMREFEKALQFEPNLAEARIEFSCLLIDAGKLTEAEAMLAKGLELAPDDLQGQICGARLTAQKGDVSGALQELQSLSFRHGRSPELHFYLGELYEISGKQEQAAAEFKKAYELLWKQELKE